MHYREEIYLFERQSIIECFLVSMIGNSDTVIPNGFGYILISMD
jgi:hypothetical protein